MTKQNRAKRNRTEWNRTEQNRREENRTVLKKYENINSENRKLLRNTSKIQRTSQTYRENCYRKSKENNRQDLPKMHQKSIKNHPKTIPKL